jgi:hypothetical protein
MQETEAGGLSPGGRFARMEGALDRIEAKLDAKADQTTVHDMGVRVALLEVLHSNREAVSAAQDKARDNQYRTIWTVVGFLTVVNIIMGTVISVVALNPFG